MAVRLHSGTAGFISFRKVDPVKGPLHSNQVSRRTLHQFSGGRRVPTRKGVFVIDPGPGSNLQAESILETWEMVMAFADPTFDEHAGSSVLD